MVIFAVCDAHRTPSSILDTADSRIAFIKLFDEVCQKFNISVPAPERYGSGNGTNVKAEYWSNGNGGSGGYGGGGGGGGGSWQHGAASSVTANALLLWIFGSVACAITLNFIL
jgi:uncharacterized membrane protein YgcG